MGADERDRVERFLYAEARLLDERRYEEWVELFTDHGVYRVPAGHDGPADRAVALIYDDRQRLRERLTRMRSRTFWAQQPPTGTTRLVGNVELLEGGDEGEVVAECRFIMVCLRRHRQGLLSGVARYRLVPQAEGYLIREKLVTLLQRDESFDNLTFLV